MYSWSSFLSSLWIMRCRFMLHHYWYFFMIQYVKTHYFIFNPIINSFATPIHLPYQCVSDVYHQPCYFFWIIALLQFHWVHLMWDFCYIFYCTSIFHLLLSAWWNILIMCLVGRCAVLVMERMVLFVYSSNQFALS